MKRCANGHEMRFPYISPRGDCTLCRREQSKKTREEWRKRQPEYWRDLRRLNSAQRAKEAQKAT